MWDKLKKILEYSNGRGIIIEDGEPRYVILSIDEYISLKEGSGSEKKRTQPLVSNADNQGGGTQNNADGYNYANPSQNPSQAGFSDQDKRNSNMQDTSSRNIGLDDLPLA
ncbi:MAG: hypothetical protein R3346_00285 [Candidatus Spechtbacterales bacterium]|nr:hypothetical protein [Candidatus Spechtbacterales bacterium]